ncbi:uncharacterized protein LOC118268800 [Spodoptera frugiperda]|uniref:Uncharacterized protein LOC118268800 n=1 Tax=Spodoptera frugiperda TaxID=7108 RepID=A0A9R0D3W8_SPOFR|nr:uncharacterized protein LOC118268800 [Spodoptera frugiperda]
MVRVTPVLARIPVIKFRKGGLGGASRPAAAAAPASAAPSASAAPAAAPAQMQPKAAMSTSVPDIDLPLRYRRQPLSDEEIAYINGGGIV